MDINPELCLSLASQACSNDWNSDDDDEHKSSPRMVPCLLCGQVAVTYDFEGNVIKQESSRVIKALGYHNEVFKYLCKSLKLDDDNDDDGGNSPWDFENEPFPFCESCEELLDSLVKVYYKLEEVEKEIKERIVGAEGKYVDENLYSNLDGRYKRFRKRALESGELCGEWIEYTCVCLSSVITK